MPEEGTPAAPGAAPAPEPEPEDEDEEASIESVNADIAKRAAGAEEFATLREGAQLRLFSDGLVCVVVGHVMKKAGSQQYFQTPDQPVFSFPLPMIADVGMCDGSSFDVRTVDGHVYRCACVSKWGASRLVAKLQLAVGAAADPGAAQLRSEMRCGGCSGGA